MEPMPGEGVVAMMSTYGKSCNAPSRMLVPTNAWTRQLRSPARRPRKSRLLRDARLRPADLDKGYMLKPTVFANVNNDMIICREEIFGPVLSILGKTRWMRRSPSAMTPSPGLPATFSRLI